MAVFTLTNGTDSGPSFRGTTGNDRFNAFADLTFFPVQTLNNQDRLNGGDGKDKLSVELLNDFTAPRKLANIEVLKLVAPNNAFFIGSERILDLSKANAFNTISFEGQPGDVVIEGLKTTLDTVAIKKDNNFNTVYTINHTATAAVGASDSLLLKLNRADSELNLNFNGSSGYEEITIKSAGNTANALHLDASIGPATINVVGDQNLSIHGDALDFDSLSLFDASTLDADLEADFFGGNGGTATVLGAMGANDIFINAWADLTVVTQGGDDVVNFWWSYGDVSVDLAAGNDSLYIDEHSGDITAVLGDGDDYASYENSSGNASVDLGSGYNGFWSYNNYGDLSVVGGNDGNWVYVNNQYGNVSVSTGDAGDYVQVDGQGYWWSSTAVDLSTGGGDDDLYLRDVDGTIAVDAGSGDDEIYFGKSGGWWFQYHSFGSDDSVDGGEGEDVLVLEASSYWQDVYLLSGGTITNVETIRHEGYLNNWWWWSDADLYVDMALAGSATQLELAGYYGSDVFVDNLDYADDVVAVSNYIGGTLFLDNAFLTGDAFTLELSEDAFIGNVDVTADRLDIISTDTFWWWNNEIANASNIDSDIQITGDGDLDIGFWAAYDFASGVVDASGLTGDLVIYVGDNFQWVYAGSGDDQVWLTDAASADYVDLSAGGADVVALLESVSGDSTFWWGDYHYITGFDVADDALLVEEDLPNFWQMDTTNGYAVNAGDSVSILNVGEGDLVVANDPFNDTYNFIKFTTAQGTIFSTAEEGFDAAIGLGQIDVSGGVDVLGAYYDSSNAQMVLFTVYAGGDSTISAGDDIDVLATVSMSYTDFLAFDGDNLGFI